MDSTRLGILDVKDPVIVINRDCYRDNDIDARSGDYSKANKIINWAPKTNLQQIIEKMVTNDINLILKDKHE